MLILLDGLDRDNKAVPVIIVAKNKIQTSMLRNYLASELNVTCTVSSLAAIDCSHDRSLLLLDCSSYSSHELNKQLALLDVNCSVALLDAPHESEFEALSHWPQVKGIFYEGDKSDLLTSGIREIMEEGLWLPRKLTNSLLMHYRKSQKLKQCVSCDVLTEKEKRVLERLAVGMSNDEIAKCLNISCHTVKSHLYKVFKKIDVCNRLQASNWAKEHL